MNLSMFFNVFISYIYEYVFKCICIYVCTKTYRYMCVCVYVFRYRHLRLSRTPALGSKLGPRELSSLVEQKPFLACLASLWLLDSDDAFGAEAMAVMVVG